MQEATVITVQEPDSVTIKVENDQATTDVMTTTSQEDLHQCRHCQEEDRIVNMIQPCKCAGNVHEQCLVRWLRAEEVSECDVCHEEYDVEGLTMPKSRVRKYS